MYYIEEMSLNAWPALQTVLYQGCVYRFSDGYTNRANSANPLYASPDSFHSIVDFAETIYAKNNVPSVFKILSFPHYQALDTLLVSKQYEKITETTVMTCSLKNRTAYIDDSVTVETTFTQEWFDAFCSLNNINQKHYDTAWKMLNAIKNDVIAASIRNNTDNRIIACGYGALENTYAGLFDIVVDKDFRHQGLGFRLVSSILGHAQQKGIESSYLQVVQSNEHALKLYQKIGFTPSYSYWYRKKNMTAL